MPSCLLQVRGLEVQYFVDRRAKRITAVRDVSFHLNAGETLALVGESGSGKSTTARAIVNLLRPTRGEILVNGQNVLELSKQSAGELRQCLQMVFQDPFAALNPRLTVAATLAEPLKVFGICPSHATVTRRVAELLELVGLPIEAGQRYPHEFSGGQRQRVAIARALSLEPKILICDEAVSALDVSVRAHIIGLLRSLQQRLGLAVLFITHDLNLVRAFADRVAVMYSGRIVETGSVEQIFTRPLHPYTQALIASNLLPDLESSPVSKILAGEPPSPVNPPRGCHFHPRCKSLIDRCRHEAPQTFCLDLQTEVACFVAAAALKSSASCKPAIP